jgi:Fe-S cluster biosynthesis and repair protein YggX/ketosteroid isomerase-like protein
LLQKAYTAFNRREIEIVLALMHADVDWPNGMEGGRVLGKDAVRDYWTRQFEVVQSQVEPKKFAKEADGRVAIDVHQVVHDNAGKLLADQMVQHVYEIRDGLIRSMEIRSRFIVRKVMAHTVFCVKFKKEMPGLEEPPFDNDLGKKVYDNVSQEAWKMWTEHCKMLLNEYRLNPARREDQEVIVKQMEQFFFGEGSAKPKEYVPPAK